MARLHQTGSALTKAVCIAIAISLFIVVGCEKQNELADSNTGSQDGQAIVPQGNHVGAPARELVTTGLKAAEILDKLNDRYASAKSYQDEAMLYLSYRLHGQSMTEPQPWSIKWDNGARLSAKLFKARMQADGELLSCFIYDIDSGNMDNQHLLVPYQAQLPLNQFFRDSIAKYFVAGYSELPLDESNLSAAPRLVPPTLAMLSPEMTFDWLQNPEKAQRLTDAIVDEEPCYVVRSLAHEMTADAYVSKTDFSLVQVSLPLKLLAGKVITSDEVTDVEFIAKFHKAVFDQELTEDDFGIVTRPDATPVRKFVSLPDAFPSELIGEAAPEFHLTVPDGNSKTRIYFDGKVTAFVWLAGSSSYSAVEKLADVARKFPGKDFHVAAVYSDAELKNPETGSQLPEDKLAAVLKATNLPVYYDRQLVASSQLKVSVIPSVLVMDGDSKIQFSRPLTDKHWEEDLAVVLERVAKGHDVATEMKAEYQQFLDSYHQQLATLSAIDLLPEGSIPATAVSSATDLNRGPIQLRPQQAWAVRDFKKSGNVAFLQGGKGGGRFFVFDGWQTIVELDSNGQQSDRKVLRLPEGEAVSCVRFGKRNNQEVFAFGPLGDKVFLFDENWQSVGTYPSHTNHKGIRDCKFTDLNNDGDSELVVAFDDATGVHLVDPASLKGQSISELASTSVAMVGDDVVVASDGKIGRLKAGVTAADETELSFKRIVSLDSDQMCGVGVSSQGKWTAVGLSQDLKRTWALSVGSQFFECEIEPVTSTRTKSGETIWAIADTENVIHLVSGSGRWLGDFQSNTPLAGICLANVNGETRLLVANQTGVECWVLNID